MKQARAFGLGVVLATQNPVDLDYKGLGNAGTWFIGRLQTERDKNRVLDGLDRPVIFFQGLDDKVVPPPYLAQRIMSSLPGKMASAWWTGGVHAAVVAASLTKLPRVRCVSPPAAR